MQFPHKIKKFILLAGGVALLSFLSLTNARAADADPSIALLTAIKENTANTLVAVSGIPDFILKVATPYMSSWTDPDAEKDSLAPEMQVNFVAIGNEMVANMDTQNAKQLDLTAEMLGLSTSDFSAVGDAKPAVMGTVPQVNKLAFATMLGTPPLAKGAETAYDYLKTAAGFSIKHETPSASWGGSQPAKDRYTGLFNTLYAVKSYDAYVLSGLWAELTNKNSLTASQKALVTQASSSDWLQQVAAEKIGIVLRQILMFVSQSYVLQTQSLQIQKQQLAATAMTNTLLIANSYTVELQMKGRAKGVMTLE